MKNKILLFLSFLVIASLTSCGSSSPSNIPMGIDKLSMLDKGMTYEKFLTYQYNNDEGDYIFDLETSLSKTKAKILLYDENLFSTDYSSFKKSTYLLDIFIFVDNKLYTWGRLDDLKNSDESEVRDLANKVSIKLIEEM